MLKTRTFKIYKKESYKIPSVGLLKSWTFKNTSLIPRIVLNGHKIKFDFKDKIDMAVLRNYIRNFYPEEPEDNELITLESKLYKEQLICLEFYKQIPLNKLYDCIFNRDISIEFDFGENQIPEELDIEEEYIERV